MFRERWGVKPPPGAQPNFDHPLCPNHVGLLFNEGGGDRVWNFVPNPTWPVYGNRAYAVRTGNVSWVMKGEPGIEIPVGGWANYYSIAGHKKQTCGCVAVVETLGYGSGHIIMMSQGGGYDRGFTYSQAAGFGYYIYPNGTVNAGLAVVPNRKYMVGGTIAEPIGGPIPGKQQVYVDGIKRGEINNTLGAYTDYTDPRLVIGLVINSFAVRVYLVYSYVDKVPDEAGMQQLYENPFVFFEKRRRYWIGDVGGEFVYEGLCGLTIGLQAESRSEIVCHGEVPIRFGVQSLVGLDVSCQGLIPISLNILSNISFGLLTFNKLTSPGYAEIRSDGKSMADLISSGRSAVEPSVDGRNKVEIKRSA